MLYIMQALLTAYPFASGENTNYPYAHVVHAVQRAACSHDVLDHILAPLAQALQIMGVGTHPHLSVVMWYLRTERCKPMAFSLVSASSRVVVELADIMWRQSWINYYLAQHWSVANDYRIGSAPTLLHWAGDTEFELHSNLGMFRSDLVSFVGDDVKIRFPTHTVILSSLSSAKFIPVQKPQGAEMHAEELRLATLRDKNS